MHTYEYNYLPIFYLLIQVNAMKELIIHIYNFKASKATILKLKAKQQKQKQFLGFTVASH